jgi:uncharacterized protein (DUF2141 family)
MHLAVRRVAYGLAFVLLVIFSAFGAELRLQVDGLRSAKGQLLIGLYDSKQSFDRALERSDTDGFLNDPERVAGAAVRTRAALQGGIVFTHLAPGRYAIILLHDEDGNGRLNKNFWGVPTEPYGFSNDAQGFLGPPGFKDAAFEIGSADKTMTITLVNHGAGVARLAPGDEPAKLSPASGAGR